MVRRLNHEDAILEEVVDCRSRGAPTGIGGVGDPTRETFRDTSGENSLSVVAGVVEEDDGELRLAALFSLILDGERVSTEPIFFRMEIGLDPAMVLVKLFQGSGRCFVFLSDRVQESARQSKMSAL